MAWIASWTASPQGVWLNTPPATLAGQTLRQVARVSLGGQRARVLLSNAYGQAPLHIGAAHVALSTAGAGIQPGSGQHLTFNGAREASIAPGALLLSDPVDLPLAPLARVAISLYFPTPTPIQTLHVDGHQTAWLTAGNQVDALRIDGTTITQRPLLAAIWVEAPAGARAIVALGDSITDGDGSTLDGNDRWPDLLAERLHAAGMPLAVLNQGISGARLLSSLMGENALARFDRDVLAQPGVDTLILLLGINDLGLPGTALGRHDPVPDADALIAGYRQLLARAHAHGIRVLGATLLPFASTGDGYYSPAKEQIRQQVNAFIRDSGEFDGVIDFDRALADPQQPDRLHADYHKGDHLHPSPAGYRRMADSIDLQLLMPPTSVRD